MSKFSPTEKREWLERIMAERLRLYTRWITAGTMTLEEAEHWMDLMREIATDYLELEERLDESTSGELERGAVSPLRST